MQQKFVDGKLVSSSEAQQEFVDVWIAEVDANYVSPYAQTGRMLAGEKRFLEGASLIQNSIVCIQPYDSIAFQVNPTNFPVYVKDSIYNTDPNYDFGVFTTLENKLLYAQLAITSFMVGFTYEGTFVFGDYQTPLVPQTVVKVTSDKEVCQGSQRWPLTSENMEKLGIVPQLRKLNTYSFWVDLVPPFWIAMAFVCLFLQHRVEKGIEEREIRIKAKRENTSQALEKYFKKKEQKFDKVNFLGDIYKLI